MNYGKHWRLPEKHTFEEIKNLRKIFNFRDLKSLHLDDDFQAIAWNAENNLFNRYRQRYKLAPTDPIYLNATELDCLRDEVDQVAVWYNEEYPRSKPETEELKQRDIRGDQFAEEEQENLCKLFNNALANTKPQEK